MESLRSALLIRGRSAVSLHNLAAHWDILILLGILCLALALRLVDLGSVPRNVTADEMDNLQTVYHIWEGTGPSLFGFDWKPSPAYSTHVMATTMRLFGDNVAALRLSSVLQSVLALIPFYFLARQVVSRPAALVATVLMSTSLCYLHFSRSGWEAVYGAFHGAAAALCLSVAVRNRSRLFYGLCGFFCALGLLLYYASTFIIAGIFAYLPFALLLHREQRKQILLGYGITFVVALLIFAPQLVSILGNWEYAMRRIGVVSVFALQGPYLGDASVGDVLRSQFFRVLRGFFLMDAGVMGYGLWGRYIPGGRALLDLGTSVFFWIGLGSSIYYWRRTLLWWSMFLLLLVPQVFSTGTPDVARGIVLIPFVYLFVALGIHAVMNGLWTVLKGSPVRRAAFSLAAVVLLCLFSFIAWTNVRDYFNWISSPTELKLREPAVEVGLFPYWQELASQAAREGRLLSWEEWQQWLQQSGKG